MQCNWAKNVAELYLTQVIVQFLIHLNACRRIHATIKYSCFSTHSTICRKGTSILASFPGLPQLFGLHEENPFFILQAIKAWDKATSFPDFQPGGGLCGRNVCTPTCAQLCFNAQKLL